MTDETTGSGEQYGLECSKLGDNSYTHGCSVYGGQRHYAMCLKVMERIKDPTSPMKNYDANCAKAINNGPQSCPALALRAKEEKVGHSLYYVPRAKAGLPPLPKDQLFSDSFQRGYRGNTNRPPRGPDRVIPSHPMGSSAPSTRSSAPAPRPVRVTRPSEPKLDTTNLHGELVNKLLKEESK